MKAPSIQMTTKVGCGVKVIIKPKGQGRGIMVSNFIEEHNDFLRLSDNEFTHNFLICSKRPEFC